MTDPSPACGKLTRPPVVYLVHHADAVMPDVDSRRPLSNVGRFQADRLAERARASGCAPEAIFHSGKLRSRQTAEAFLRLCAPLATFKMIRGLAPDAFHRLYVRAVGGGSSAEDCCAPDAK